MKIFTIKVFDHTGISSRKWERFFERANIFLQMGGVQLVYAIERMEKRIPVFYPQANGVRHNIDEDWFKKTYSANSKGFDFCMALFRKSDWRKPYKKNDLGGQSINENYGVSEIALIGSMTTRSPRPLAPKFKESELLVRFLHELCHGICDHKALVPDITHECHYNKKDLLSAFPTWGYLKKMK